MLLILSKEHLSEAAMFTPQSRALQLIRSESIRVCLQLMFYSYNRIGQLFSNVHNIITKKKFNFNAIIVKYRKKVNFQRTTFFFQCCY